MSGGGVDQAIDAAEAGDCLGDDGGGRVRFAKVGADEGDGAGGARQPLAHRLASSRIAADDRDAGRAAFCGQPGDGFAEPLGSAGDDQRLAFESHDQWMSLQLWALVWL